MQKYRNISARGSLKEEFFKHKKPPVRWAEKFELVELRGIFGG